MRRVLVISPHPDDESIGCGGAVRKHVEDGDSVRVIYLTSGEKGGHGRDERETAQLREEEAKRAVEILGIEGTEFYRLPDRGVRAGKAEINRLTESLVDWTPDHIYLPHQDEMHVDHRAAVRLLKRALACLPDYRPRVLMYETWTPLQQLDEIVDISPYLDIKVAAVRAHQTQCAVMDFDAAIVGLNRYRGEMHSWPGGDYAEVFAELHLDNGKGRR